MVNIGGNIWSYADWQPSSSGVKDYEIWMCDNNGNWNYTSGSILVFESDLLPPTWNNLTESSDPLELGQIEVIRINVTDPSGINTVYLEFEGINHSMVNIDGDQWEYSTWQPNSVGLHSYIVWMEDNNGNWNVTMGNVTVLDTISPTWSDLIEDFDPLELGMNFSISLNITDISGINTVYFEVEGINYSMVNTEGETWIYSDWQPISVGFREYKIWMEDNNGNWNFTTGNLVVEDTVSPSWSSLLESGDPLLLGLNETITINVTDLSGVNRVYLEYDDVNHSMLNIIGNQWYYSDWQPSSTGTFIYRIWMEDNNSNWNVTTGSIFVFDVDSSPPEWMNLTEDFDPLELGQNQTISVDVTDPSGINTVLLEYEGMNHSMINIGGNTWSYSDWRPSTIGLHFYTIWMEDNNIETCSSS